MPKKRLTPQEYFTEIRAGNRIALAQAITLVESNKLEHQKLAQELIQLCLPHSGQSMRIGITGIPGVGKSTFIEVFGDFLIKQGKKIAVLAIDPSSEQNSGSILGDKTRMNSLSQDKQAFIRPSPNSGNLGGVAKSTRESIILCEAACYDVILIETVGVGQSETTVYQLVDFFLLLMLSGAGDELQGIKRGVMEMADLLVVNKADGNNLSNAEKTEKQLDSALHLFPVKSNNWIPKVTTCSSSEKTGLENIWQIVCDYFMHTKENDSFAQKRIAQNKFWLKTSIQQKLEQQFYNKEGISRKIKEMENRVIKGEISPFYAAEELVTDS